MMETHDADSKAGERIGEPFRFFVGAEVCAEAQVRSEKSFLSVGGDKGTVLALKKPSEPATARLAPSHVLTFVIESGAPCSITKGK